MQVKNKNYWYYYNKTVVPGWLTIIIIVVYFMVFAPPCGVLNNNEIVEYSKNTLKNDFIYFNKIINVFNSYKNKDCDYSFHYDMTFDTLYLDTDTCCNGIHQKLQMSFKKVLTKKSLPAYIKGDKYIGFELKKRNKNLDHFNMLYFFDLNFNKDSLFKNYKFYNTNKEPLEVGGWLYHVKDNWCLKSPFPEKE